MCVAVATQYNIVARSDIAETADGARMWQSHQPIPCCCFTELSLWPWVSLYLQSCEYRL